MPPADNAVPFVNLEQWMAAQQDLSDFDETLDEQSARLFLLHQRLASPQHGPALAEEMVRASPPAIPAVAALVNSDEPRMSVMVMYPIHLPLEQRAMLLLVP
jgi:hypothetical protein